MFIVIKKGIMLMTSLSHWNLESFFLKIRTVKFNSLVARKIHLKSFLMPQSYIGKIFCMRTGYCFQTNFSHIWGGRNDRQTVKQLSLSIMCDNILMSLAHVLKLGTRPMIYYISNLSLLRLTLTCILWRVLETSRSMSLLHQ